MEMPPDAGSSSAHRSVAGQSHPVTVASHSTRSLSQSMAHGDRRMGGSLFAGHLGWPALKRLPAPNLPRRRIRALFSSNSSARLDVGDQVAGQRLCIDEPDQRPNYRRCDDL
ncbi:hypothetical protein NW767_008350 [Fusarium falciforme]|nr:hypothetical protein NW767_008350 [Fusarium falciforme]